MRLQYLKSIGCVLMFLCIGYKSNAQTNTLWYNQAARNWDEALPIGNGFIGAMVYGGVNKEQLSLNENTLYSGDPTASYKGVNTKPTYNEIVALLKNKKNTEAEELVRKHWLGKLPESYQALGDLWINFDQDGEVTNYKRSLNISKAILTVSYTQNGINFKREIFASHPDKAIIIKLSASKAGALNFNVNLSSVHPTARQNILNNSTIKLTGKVPGYANRRTFGQMEGWKDMYKHPQLFDSAGKRKFDKTVLYGDEVGGLGMLFESQLKTTTTGGSVTTNKDGIKVKNATEAILVLASATSYNGFDKSPVTQGVDPAKKNNAVIKSVSAKPYSTLVNAHLADYKRLFDRVSLSLGGENMDNVPTDERIIRFKEKTDNGLATLLFQFGRYLMISASREGGQPMNLQGMWNKDVLPPWNSGYTININTEMNYWPSEITNLSECNAPLFQMIKEIAHNGTETAQKMYGINRGWVSHHNMSIWRETFSNDNTVAASYWGMAGGWLSRHLWEHYLFTGDQQFLKEKAYPLMKGSALFFADWLIENENKKLVTPVSTSPENRFFIGDKEAVSLSMGSTMDMTIIREIFNNTIKASEKLNVDSELRKELQAKLDRLLPFKIGAKGQLQEWQEDYKEVEPKHRHISHLYGLYPGNQINADITPELFNAVEKTLAIRGDGATGWSMGWKINIWARLLDGNHAYEIIKNLFNPIGFKSSIDGEPLKPVGGGGLYMNLFDACPPFQIDGNFGFTSGVAEMLVQSHAGFIQLLPALPQVWSKGYVKGLKTRGGFEIAMNWDGQTLKKATIKSTLGGLCRVRSEVPLKVKGVKVSVATGENKNPYFQFINPGQPEITSTVNITKDVSGKKYYTIDFETTKGMTYELNP